MKTRSKKLLALTSVFLAAVIFAVIAVVGFAADEPKRYPLYITDYQDGLLGQSGVSHTTKEWTQFQLKTTNDGNYYAEQSHIYYKPTSSSSVANAFYDIGVMSNVSVKTFESSKNIGDYEHITVDFDFMSETGDYHYSNISITPVVRAYNASKTEFQLSKSFSLTLKEKDDVWCLNSTPIKQGAYTWNHVSIVFNIKYDETNGYADTTYQVFATTEASQGNELTEIVKETKLFSSSYSADSSKYYNGNNEDVFLTSVRIAKGYVEGSHLSGDTLVDDYSICYDNTKVYVYDNGYTGGITHVYDGTLPRGLCYAKIDGIFYEDKDAAKTAISNATESIEIFDDFSDTELTVKDTITLKLNGHALDYTLPSGYREIDNGDGSVTISNKYTVYWHFGDGNITEQIYTYGDIPTPAYDATAGKTVLINGITYNILGGWTYTDGSATAVQIGAVTSDTHYFPTRESVANYFAYTTSAGGNLTTVTSEDVAESGQALKSLVENNTSGYFYVQLLSDLEIHTNITPPAGSTLYVDVAGFSYTYSFVSYHTYVYDSEGKVTSTGWDAGISPGKNPTFNLKTGVNLYLYSSVPGGKFFNSLYNRGDGTYSDDGLTFTPKYNSKGAISNEDVRGWAIVNASSSIKNSVVNIGDVTFGNTDYSGDNLSTYSANLIYHSGDSSNKVYINGGSYYRSIGDNLSLIMTGGSVDVDIKNAKLVGDKQNIFSTYNGTKDTDVTYADVSLDGCTVYTTASLFARWAKGAKLEITNSCIIANLTTPLQGGTVIIGEGVRIGSNKTVTSTDITDVNGNTVKDISRIDGLIDVKTTEIFNITLNFNKFKYIRNVNDPDNSVYNKYESELTPDTNVLITVSKVTALPGSYSTVTWNYADQSVTENWLHGIVPTCPFDIPEATEIYKFEAPNVKPAVGGESITYTYVQKSNIEIMMNMTLYTDFVYNIYIPEKAIEHINSVKINGEDHASSGWVKNKEDVVEFALFEQHITASEGADVYTLELEIVGYNGIPFTQQYTFSIPKYADRVLNGGYNESTVNLMNKTLAYVKSACTYFGNTEGADSIGDVGAIEDIAGYEIANPLPVAFRGATLSLGSKIKFRFSATEKKTLLDTVFTYSVKSEDTSESPTESTVKSASGYYYFDIALRASDLTKDITLTYGGDSYTYNLANYIYGVDKDKTPELKTLVNALWAYSKASEAFVDGTPVTSITIDGNSIENYVIVANDTEELDAAAILQNQFYLKTGHKLDIVSEATEKAIIVNVEPFSSNDYTAKVVDGNLVITCAFNSFVESATSNFADDYIKTIFKDYDFGSDFIAAYTAKYITYTDFGAVGDGIAVDYDAMKLTHDVANQKNYTVKVNDGIYNIGKNTTPIIIKTNVDWTGATIYTDDSVIHYQNDSDAKYSALFKIASEYTPITHGENSELVKKINAAGGIDKDEINNTLNFFDYSTGYRVMLFPTNANKKVYIRYGINENDGGDQHELIVLDENGNLDPKTTLLLSYDEVTSITEYRIDDTPITIKGGTFITIANNAPCSYASGYYGRNISVERSNVTIYGLTHQIKEEGSTGAPYSGFISASYCSDLLVESCTLQAHRSYVDETVQADGTIKYGSTMGTYDISGGNANNMYFKDCVQSNFTPDNLYRDENGLTVLNNNKKTAGLWGIMGTNYCKNITYDGCKLSRLDAHSGVVNATVKNSEIIHIALIGGGTATITDSIVYGNRVIDLREDYGSTWNGDVIIQNVHLVNSSTWVNLITGTWYNHYFGYETYMPRRILVDNVTYEMPGTAYIIGNYTVEKKTVTTEDGEATQIDDYFDFTKSTVTIGETTSENKNPMHLPEFIDVRNADENMIYRTSSDTFISEACSSCYENHEFSPLVPLF